MDAATTPDAPDTKQLVSRARQGEREAFAELVRRFQRPVRGYVSRWIRDSHAADDVSQEVFVVAYQQLRTFEGTGDFLSWLLGIARHRSLTTLRAATRRNQRHQSHLEQLIAQRRWELLDKSTVDSEHEQLLHDSLRDCLAGLAPRARELIAAHYFERRSAESIAESLQRKGNAIRMTLLRIRRSLADCVQRKLNGRERAS